ncbi:MAG: metallophosphoesterase family protein [Acidimicrobiales bacterium]
MSFCFIHAADLHLDTPFKQVGSDRLFIKEALQDASLKAFDALIDLAEKKNAAFVLFAGDIYDGPERGVRAQLHFRRGLMRLNDLGIHSFVVHGNHDPLDAGWSAIRDWPQLATVFGHDTVESVVVERDSVQLATVHGISFARTEETGNLALRFTRGNGPGLQVGVLHCNVGGDAEHDSYAPCTLDDLTRVGLDYWALGHIHSRRILQTGHPWVVYPGNIQGRSPKPSECGAKGAYVVEVADSTVQAVDFVPLDVVRFEEIQMDIGGTRDMADLERMLIDKAASLQASAEGRSLLVQTTLSGSGPVHDDLAREGSLAELLRELRCQADERVPFLWWNTIRDETRPMLDLQAIRRRGDFASELLALSDDLAEDPDLLRDFVRDSLSGLPERRLETMGVDALTGIDKQHLQQAILSALELLEHET